MRLSSILILLIGFISQPVHAAFWLVMKQLDSAEPVQLNRQQIRQAYLGKPISIGKDLFCTPVSLEQGNSLRKQFNAQVIGLTEARLQSYWAHMRFSGRKKPPQEVATTQQLFSYLNTKQGSIGYVAAGTELPSGIVRIYPHP